MEIKNIYPEWISEYHLTLDELMSIEKEQWHKILVDRVLLIIKGLGNSLTDAEYHAIGTKFGRVWDIDDYRKTPSDGSIRNKETTPVSYFATGDNSWGAREMKYHSDMAHMGKNSFPARSLYMVESARNGTGKTSWLNLELAWEQFTDTEKAEWNGFEVVQHDMYRPDTKMETFPFLKTNPNSGKISPRINCYVTPGRNRKSWIHHLINNGSPIVSSGPIIEKLCTQCESKNNAFYTHSWDEGDILIYDNFGSLHKREPVTFEENEGDRLLKRLTFNITQ